MAAPELTVIPGGRTRNFPDWLAAYMQYASYSEAPEQMHFWAGVSAIAGALRRQVWLTMGHFKWHVNHYVILVAPPGIVSKSTTAAISINLLRKIPGVKFGPNSVTWPALVSAFAESNESFEYNGEFYPQCALTLEASEFGNLVNPDDRQMIDLLVELWDSKQGGFDKRTKSSGNDMLENPWINLIACTTPAWIAGSFPEYLIGGGFTSRCIFVYAEVKSKLIAYPVLHMPKDLEFTSQKLVQDLERISLLKGPFTMTSKAIEWGEAWYAHHHKNPPAHLRDDRFGGYLARKQTHLHKLAMVLSVARGDSLEITEEDLYLAANQLSLIEADMPKVFAKIGKSDEALQVDRFVSFIRNQGEVPYVTAYQYIHSAFPKLKNFEDMVAGAIKAQLIEFSLGKNGQPAFKPGKELK